LPSQEDYAKFEIAVGSWTGRGIFAHLSNISKCFG
jgi:hypothetical protein